MFSTLAVVALFLAVANSAYTGPLGGLSSAQYPAGVDPKACPNYPVCENPSVAVNQVPVSAYSSQYQPQLSAHYTQPQYTQQYNPAAVQSQYQIPQSGFSSPVQQYSLGQAGPAQIQQRHYNLALPQNQNYAAQQPQQQYSANLQAALDRGEYIGDGDYHGEGLAESGAQGQVAASYNPAAYQQAYSAPVPQQSYQASNQQYTYQGIAQPAQLPAGLAPGACPNYPFCHQ